MLFLSALYTVQRLKTLFGDKFEAEVKRMAMIMVIFGITSMIKSAYLWAMYSLNKRGDSETVLKMINY